jgi:hypothetical protein
MKQGEETRRKKEEKKEERRRGEIRRISIFFKFLGKIFKVESGRFPPLVMTGTTRGGQISLNTDTIDSRIYTLYFTVHNPNIYG